MSLEAALPLLRCPVCGAPLHLATQVVRCAGGHAFDIARQGYVNLTTGARHHGDTAAMIAARQRFLAAGHYAPVAAAVTAAVAEHAPPGPVLDLAAGTGWYAARLLDGAPDRVGVAVDVSTAGLRRAARAHPRLAAVGADAWATLPVPDGAFAVVLSVFGPRTAGEIARVLRPGGVAVVASPAPEHLAEAVGPLGMVGVDAAKPDRLREAFADFSGVGPSTAVRQELALTHAALRDLVTMGPTGHHLDEATVAARVAAVPEPFTVTAAVDVTVFRRG